MFTVNTKLKDGSKLFKRRFENFTIIIADKDLELLINQNADMI
jgi:hypothetical protein